MNSLTKPPTKPPTSSIENIIKNIFEIIKLNEHCVIEYYPHINLVYNCGGYLKNETVDKLNLPDAKYNITTDSYTEYIHREKKMIIHENGEKDFVKNHQIHYHIQQIDETIGLIVISEFEYIDPNKFPILHKYYDVVKKNIINYDDRFLTVSLITENPNEPTMKKYIKISFNIPKNFDELCKKRIIKHLKEALSLIPSNQ